MATDSIPDKMVISLKGKRALYKGDLMILEMLAQCNWERPIYVAVSVGDDNYINLGDNVITEGLAYRITPFTTTHEGKPIPGVKNFDTEKTYDNVMHRFKFGGIDKPGIYLDETVMRMCYTHRRTMAKLALELMYEGQDKKAEEVLRYTEKMIPSFNVAHNFSSGSLDMARTWASLGHKKEALNIINQMWKTSVQYMKWFCSLEQYRFDAAKHDCMVNFYILEQLASLTEIVDEKTYNQQMKELTLLGNIFEQRNPNEKAVYLTFDDGPIPEATPFILDTLKHYGIKATFFMVGDNVRKYPELHKRVVEEGHRIGNHTHNHMGGLRHSVHEYSYNVEKANAYLHTNLVRPPHGWMRHDQYAWLSRKFKIVMWDLVTRDYSKWLTAADVLNNVKRYARNGSIITFHDSLKSIEKLRIALPAAIEWLLAEGYAFKIFE